MAKDNFFEATGKKIDEFIAKVPIVLERRRVQRTPVQHESSFDNVVKTLIARAGQDVEVYSIDSTFEYNDIIKWVEKNAVGNTLYIAKSDESTDTQRAICVFFGQDETILSGDQYPKVCYFYKELNPSIMDVFTDGMNVFVQSIKIVEE